MTATATHAAGTFCWLDLAAHDPVAARAFYTAFFGWEAVDRQYGPTADDVYTLYYLDGQDAGASYTMDAPQKAGGMPSAWLMYVAVESADESAARAKELGGALMVEPFDVMEVGRMALVQDPTGAILALWEARSHSGVGQKDVPGTLGWAELATPDTARAGAFYSALFGWRGETQDVGMEYTVFKLGEQMVGGMYRLTSDKDMPPCWMPYFVVSDADEAAAHGRRLGAAVLMEPMDIPSVGRMVLFRDPQGAMFYVIAWARPAAS